MKTSTALAFAAALALSSASFAQPSGGPEAKGNAPLKAAHTVNDGTAKPGANSFTENQARKHILKSGYASVSALTKGSDGVWRGVATKDGAPVDVALDFKGNVSEAMHPASAPVTSASVAKSGATGAETTSAQVASDGATSMHHHHHHHRRHHHASSHYVKGEKMDGQGAAMSGVDRNDNGISDKEDRALKH